MAVAPIGPIPFQRWRTPGKCSRHHRITPVLTSSGPKSREVGRPKSVQGQNPLRGGQPRSDPAKSRYMCTNSDQIWVGVRTKFGPYLDLPPTAHAGEQLYESYEVCTTTTAPATLPAAHLSSRGRNVTRRGFARRRARLREVVRWAHWCRSDRHRPGGRSREASGRHTDASMKPGLRNTSLAPRAAKPPEQRERPAGHRSAQKHGLTDLRTTPRRGSRQKPREGNFVGARATLPPRG